jgi:membrane fusion protein, multidrug efflux system
LAYFIAILMVLGLLGTLGGLKAAQIQSLMAFGEQAQKAGPPPESVGTARVEQRTWPRQRRAVGTLVSGRGVAVSADAPGIVDRIRFESGGTVQRGQVLVELDASVERAQLQAVQARLKLAEQTLEQSQQLFAAGAVPRNELDAAVSTRDGLIGDQQALHAQIERKLVRAPFAGRLGMREVNLGQYLAPGATITTLESAEALLVEFALPQQDQAQLRSGASVRVLSSASGELLAGGRLTAIEPSVDVATRMVTARATLDLKTEPKAAGSPDLHPGMFVSVEVQLPESETALVVPATAVVRAPYGDSVYVVEPKAAEPGAAAPSEPSWTAVQHFVRLTGLRGDFAIVERGLEVGQQIVAAGAFKLRNGSPIKLVEAPGPTPQFDPQVQNR